MTPAKWIHQGNQHNSVSNKRDKTSNFISGPKFSYYQGEEGLPNLGWQGKYIQQARRTASHLYLILLNRSGFRPPVSFSASLIKWPGNTEVYCYSYVGPHFQVHSKHLSVNAETWYMSRLLWIKSVHLTIYTGDGRHVTELGLHLPLCNEDRVY